MKVVHALFVNEHGCIYCKKFNAIIQLVEMRTPCLHCEKWRGTIQGEGCECEWDDFDFQGDVCVYDHVAEYDRVNSFKTVPQKEKLKVWQEKNDAARLAYERRKWG
jgi:hypothetical protein